MQIKIEIDLKPEELRRFLGLPDVSGLQEDILGFVRETVNVAGELDPTGLVEAFRRRASQFAAKSRGATGASADAKPSQRPRRKRKPAATTTTS
jgi:hypothetical protein